MLILIIFILTRILIAHILRTLEVVIDGFINGVRKKYYNPRLEKGIKKSYLRIISLGVIIVNNLNNNKIQKRFQHV